MVTQLALTSAWPHKSTGFVLPVCCPQDWSSGQPILGCIGQVYHTYQGVEISSGWIYLGYTATTWHLVFCANDTLYRCEFFGNLHCILSKFLYCTGGFRELWPVHCTFSFYWTRLTSTALEGFDIFVSSSASGLLLFMTVEPWCFNLFTWVSTLPSICMYWLMS